jgi:hypothetical protein
MANEGTATASLKVVKGTGDALWNFNESFSDLFDVSGTEAICNIQIVGTTTEAIQLGDVTTAGLFVAKNLDTTNYVEFTVESDGTSCLAKLKAGEICLFRCSAAPYGKANTAAVRIKYLLIED